jgi:hypothetical protein
MKTPLIDMSKIDMTKKPQAFWVHGVSVQAEREGNFVLKERHGYAGIFKTHGGEWFHFAVPTPVIFDGHRSCVKKVFVLYKTVGTAKVIHIHVYDGGTKIAAFEKLSLTGDHSNNVDAWNSWEMPNALAGPTSIHMMSFGLGISVFVDFGGPTTGDVPEIWFTAAGADFETGPVIMLPTGVMEK